MTENTNPWIVKAPKQTAPVPIGFYHATFKGVEDFTLPATGEVKWRFVWEITAGECKGKTASSLTNVEINANTLSGRLIAGLIGRPIVAGDNVKAEVEACIGKVYLVSQQAGPKGGKPAVQACDKPPSM
jgi:hypothetical protein